MRFHLKRQVGQLRVDVRWRRPTTNQSETPRHRKDRRVRQIARLRARLDAVANANVRHKKQRDALRAQLDVVQRRRGQP